MTIAALAQELNETLVGCRIDKISMPSRDEVVFSLRSMQDRGTLFLSARSGSARVHWTNESFEFPATPPAFCMLLRKHLLGGRILDVQAIPGERVLQIQLEAINEMGDRVHPSLYAEMMGRYSNLVLVSEEGLVLDAIKRIDESQSDKRQLMPGIAFTLPPKPDKVNILLDGFEANLPLVQQRTELLSEAILAVFSGISPLLCRELTVGMESLTGRDVTETEAKLLVERYAYLEQATKDRALRTWTMVLQGEKAVEYAFVPLKQYRGLESKTFETGSALLDRYYAARDRELRMKNRSQDLTKQIRQLLERNRRRQESRIQDLADTQRADEKKMLGELLTANLHNFKKGDRQVTVLNYYTGEEQSIPLDVMRTPNENAQHYFKEYRKLHTAATVLQDLLREGDEEYQYLQQVEYDISQASTEEDFWDIREELRQAGYLRGVKSKTRSKRRFDPYYHYRLPSGLEVLVGKNNAANEKLSLQLASGRDLWFHVKDAPGSHVILRVQGETPDDESMTTAAEIAAYHSSQKGGSPVLVDYTLAKKVRKIPGGKRGMVTYTDQKTAVVFPKEDKLLALRAH